LKYFEHKINIGFNKKLKKGGSKKLNQAGILDYITDKGLIKAQVAQKCGIETQRFYRILNNKVKIDADEYEKLCFVLNCPLETFMANPKKIE
jgi:transcriptional regulator with XRE-family HTH domain